MFTLFTPVVASECSSEFDFGHINMADDGAVPAPQTAGKPRTRQRTYKPPPTLEVPNIEDDAAERKRVLNVLAQRRYREKKRQRRLMDDPQSNEGSQRSDTEDQETGESNSTTEAVSYRGDGESFDIVVSSSSTHGPPTSQSHDGNLGGLDTNLYGWDPLNDESFSSMLPDSGSLPDFLTGDSSTKVSFNRNNSPSFRPGAALPSILSAAFGSPGAQDNGPDLDPEIGYADSILLPVHELTLFRAMARIAKRINCKEAWKLDALSPFNHGLATPAEQLPPAWQPTSTQVIVPHHPMLDFLPWPGVRDRIIRILAMPDEVRPPNAMGPLGLVNFAYDFEDKAEGVRIYGADPYDPNSWEVGQVFFERWWFLFDREIIENSNRWRLLRGAPPLTMRATELWSDTSIPS